MSKILFSSTTTLLFVLLSLGISLVLAVVVSATSDRYHSSAQRRRHNPRRSSHHNKRPLGSLKQLPQEQCMWPFMDENLHHDFGPWTVKQLQSSVAGILKDPSFVVDGIYGPETAALVRRFQTYAKISADGATGQQTWNKIQELAYPVNYGAQGEVVTAIQLALNFQGFPVTNVTGVFDGPTVIALRNFQAARKDPSAQGGKTATATTFHLLITGCNQGGEFWLDWGWPNGPGSVETLQCLREQGKFEFATFECWVEASATGQFWSECVDNIKNAYAAGFQYVGVYMFAQRFYAPEPQVQWLLSNLTANGVKYTNIMFDIEGDKWSKYTQEQNQQFILGLKDEFHRQGVDDLVIYCGSEWPQYFGSNFTAFSQYPLVYAHYDNIPSFVDFWPAYGGWNAPQGKQFWDGIDGETICNIQLDWDWSLEPFWRK